MCMSPGLCQFCWLASAPAEQPPAPAASGPGVFKCMSQNEIQICTTVHPSIGRDRTHANLGQTQENSRHGNQVQTPPKIHFGSKKLGDGGDLLGDGGNLLSIAGGSSKTTVAQKCQGAI